MEESGEVKKWKAKPKPSLQRARSPSHRKSSQREEHPKTSKENKFHKFRKGEMMRHLQAIRERAIERRNGGEGRDYHRFKSCVLGRGRLTRPVGISAFAKQSEIVFNPEKMPPGLRRTVKEDVKALLAKNSFEDDQMWTKAPPFERDEKMPGPSREVPEQQGEKKPQLQSRGPNNRDFGLSLASDETALHNGSADFSGLGSHPSFFSPSLSTDERQQKERESMQEIKVLFPSDPPFVEMASRMLSCLPFLPLRNNSSATYGFTASGLVSQAWRIHGITFGRNEMSRKESSAEKGDAKGIKSDEDILRSFYEMTGPFDSQQNELDAPFSQLGPDNLQWPAVRSEPDEKTPNAIAADASFIKVADRGVSSTGANGGEESSDFLAIFNSVANDSSADESTRIRDLASPLHFLVNQDLIESQPTVNAGGIMKSPEMADSDGDGSVLRLLDIEHNFGFVGSPFGSATGDQMRKPSRSLLSNITAESTFHVDSAIFEHQSSVIPRGGIEQGSSLSKIGDYLNSFAKPLNTAANADGSSGSLSEGEFYFDF